MGDISLLCFHEVGTRSSEELKQAEFQNKQLSGKDGGKAVKNENKLYYSPRKADWELKVHSKVKLVLCCAIDGISVLIRVMAS